MEDTTRYYLTLLPNETWQITHQIKNDTVWQDSEFIGIYKTYEEAVATNYTPLCADPLDSWPQALGGQA